MGSQQSEFIWVFFYKGFSAWRSVFAVKKNAFLNPSLHTCTMGYLESIKCKIFWICQKPVVSGELCAVISENLGMRGRKWYIFLEVSVILNQILFIVKPPTKKKFGHIVRTFLAQNSLLCFSSLSLLTLLLKPWKCNDIINGMKGKQIV